MDKVTAIQNMKLYLFDMDGTLYLGSRLYDFTIELLAEIKRTGGKYLFITNNSSNSYKCKNSWNAFQSSQSYYIRMPSKIIKINALTAAMP